MQNSKNKSLSSPPGHFLVKKKILEENKVKNGQEAMQRDDLRESGTLFKSGYVKRMSDRKRKYNDTQRKNKLQRKQDDPQNEKKKRPNYNTFS